MSRTINDDPAPRPAGWRTLLSRLRWRRRTPPPGGSAGSARPRAAGPDDEARNRALLQHALEGVSIIDADRRIRYKSGAVTAILGYQPAELIGSEVFALIHPEDQPAAEAALTRSAARPRQPVAVDLRLRRKDGDWRTVEAAITNLLDDPAIAGFVVNYRDITPRKEAEDRLRDAEAHYRALVERMPALSYICASGDASDFVYYSPHVEQLFGFTPEEMAARVPHWTDDVHPDDRERVLAEDARTERTGDGWEVEYRHRTRDDHWVWVRDIATLVRDEQGNPRYWQGVMFDISERKAAEERLLHQAFHDALTGLPNRALFLDRLGQALARARRSGRRVGVVFIDLDDFKQVNDRYGHDAGDDLLVAVARRLQRGIRAADTVARLAGDEFTILLEGIGSDEQAARVVATVEAGLHAPFQLAAAQGEPVRITASVGLALGGREIDSPEQLLRHADAAMYQAKKTSKERNLPITQAR